MAGNLGFNSKSYTNDEYRVKQLISGIQDGASKFYYKGIGNLDGTSIDIKTPVIKIQENNLLVDHGIYYGYINNKTI